MIEPELRALDFMKIALFYLVYTSATITINQSKKKLNHNVYGHKISNEFDYGRYRTCTS